MTENTGPQKCLKIQDSLMTENTVRTPKMSENTGLIND